MRSRSSLLCHLLMSNECIYGIGESNAVYQNKIVLWKIKLKAFLKNKIEVSKSMIFVDQINHNNKTPNLKVIDNSDSRLIFLVREPNESIQSILKLTAEHYKPWSVEKAIDYYNGRLKFLLSLLTELDSRNYFILRSQDLIENTELTLDKLTKFLSLPVKLTSEYQLFSFSGIHGDPSETIKEQKIVQNKVHLKLNADLSASQLLYNKITTFRN